jgi:hypothetical protein
MKFRSMPRAMALALSVLAVVALVALAETVYVRVRSTNMFDKPDSLSGKSIERLKRGDKLKRLEKGGKWDKVQKGNVVGYVKSRNLSRKRPAKSIKKRNAFGRWLAGKDRGPQNPETVGAEGLGAMGRTYTKKHNLEKGRLVVEGEMDLMYDDEDKTKDAQKKEAFAAKVEAFQKAGGLGDYTAAPGKAVSK